MRKSSCCFIASSSFSDGCIFVCNLVVVCICMFEALSDSNIVYQLSNAYYLHALSFFYFLLSLYLRYRSCRQHVIACLFCTQFIWVLCTVTCNAIIVKFESIFFLYVFYIYLNITFLLSCLVLVQSIKYLLASFYTIWLNWFQGFWLHCFLCFSVIFLWTAACIHNLSQSI